MANTRRIPAQTGAAGVQETIETAEKAKAIALAGEGKVTITIEAPINTCTMSFNGEWFNLPYYAKGSIKWPDGKVEEVTVKGGRPMIPTGAAKAAYTKEPKAKVNAVDWKGVR